MKLRTLLCTLTAAGACLAGASLALRQESPVSQAGPEHAVLKAMVGDWDASIQMMGQTYSGKYSCRMALGGLWLIDDFEGEVMDMKFQGHGFTGYDPAKGKYVAAWIDSMTPSFSPAEGTWNKEKRELVMTMQAPNAMTGQMEEMKQVTSLPADGKTMKFSMYTKGPDGAEMETMTIEYTRRAK